MPAGAWQGMRPRACERAQQKGMLQGIMRAMTPTGYVCAGKQRAWKASGSPVRTSRASTMCAAVWPMLSSKNI